MQAAQTTSTPISAAKPGGRSQSVTMWLVIIVAPLLLVAICWRGYGFFLFLFGMLAMVVTLMALAFDLLLAVVALLANALRRRAAWVWPTPCKWLLRDALLFLALCLAFTAGLGVQNLSLYTTCQRGNVVVAALDRYHAEHGRYPETLAVLEEEMASSLPRPTLANQFDYSTNGTAFSLSFPGMGLIDYWTYSTHNRQWYRD